jgi:hypothetical protein
VKRFVSRMVPKTYVSYWVRTIAIFAISALSLFGAKAHGGMVLTAAGTAAGFSLSTFATGFPSESQPSGFAGPLGIVFPNGGVLVSDISGNVRFFPTDVDGQNAAAFPPTAGASYGSGNAHGMAMVGSNIYMNQQALGRLVQVNNNGTINQVILSGLTNPIGIVANPISGHLFISDFVSGSGPGFTNALEEVDPVAKTVSLFASVSPGDSNTGPDGVALSPDGNTLYAAIYGTSHVLGFNITSKVQVFDSGFIPGGIDGSALGTGSIAGNIFVNTNSGTVVEVNLTTLTQTVIATGGSRGDFVAVDPNNGTLLLTQSDSIERLIPPVGGGFGPISVPEPASLTLLGIGITGMAGYVLRRRNKVRAIA